jgi:hypothetical protein
MPVQLSAKFETDLVAPRTLATILREQNRATGRDIIRFVVRGKFSRSAYSEHPGVVRRRSAKYAAWKSKRVGHDIPLVLTGALKAALSNEGQYAKITATRNGGRVYLRAPWSGAGKAKRGGGFTKQGFRESVRQELEAVSPRQRDMLAKRQEAYFEKAINDPKNRRKRRKRG